MLAYRMTGAHVDVSLRKQVLIENGTQTDETLTTGSLIEITALKCATL